MLLYMMISAKRVSAVIPVATIPSIQEHPVFALIMHIQFPRHSVFIRFLVLPQRPYLGLSSDFLLFLTTTMSPCVKFYQAHLSCHRACCRRRNYSASCRPARSTPHASLFSLWDKLQVWGSIPTAQLWIDLFPFTTLDPNFAFR